MKEAYIIDGIRTPIGNFGGTLSTIRPDDMAALVIKELMKRNPSVDGAEIADVILGCANQAGEDNRNVARMALLLAGLPFSVPGETINRLCASGLSAAVAASRAIQCGDGDLFIAGGVENMTRAPWVISKASTPFGRDAQMFDSSFGWRFVNPKMEELFGTDGMGQTAENLAQRDNISREDQDQFALWSQQKAAAAQQQGRFEEEIIPVEILQRRSDPIQFDKDEFIKPATTIEALSRLRPAFRKNGTVTAGNASGLNDGAAALLLASEAGIKKHNLTPKARMVAMGVAGVEPRYMGMGPVPASQNALKKAGITINDIDVIELNEAFASQSLACIRGLGLEDKDPRINPNGGAIALGHPLGMSGARILKTAAIELHKQNKRYALVTMCVGVGQGYAVVIEKV
ncbi:3-oxoadipyl-CoA thiolase [Pontibacter harenae]|uniref:3-oxoadipyl-CoA thiolase n=1 Tax=Pontibacter harenae TaxID=2894083 RepID=UPI001E5AF73D|nr:3-oxoadipyl-CoA thiolase [Pontibacter harenae]MCC9167964.1 3-oxoadipyl-CoA thiolase [Pontibacter harenae]